MKRVQLFLLFAFSLFFAWPALSQRVTLPQCFSHHMVLQRDMPIPVWGEAAPDQEVRITFRDEPTSAFADEDGKWMMRLPAGEAGGPFRFVVEGGETFENVLVGDVWLGSGQSNMAGGAGGYAKRDEVLKGILDGGPYENIRLSSRGGWKPFTKEDAQRFSALLLSFGVELQKSIDVPVGLRVGAVGGTPSGRWLTKPMFMVDRSARVQLEEHGKKADWDKIQARHAAQVAKWEAASAKAKAEGKRTMRKPRLPQKPGHLPSYVGNLYEQHILPFEGYGIKGVLWDQGESGTGIPGVDQYVTMGALIKGWRGAFRQNFPFIYVQKPSGGGPAWDRERPETRMAEPFASRVDRADGAGGRVPAFDTYRLHHIAIAQHPRTAMVQSVDLGSGVHPSNKSGYGARAALVARGFVYGEDVVWSGPSYKKHEVKDNEIHISFTNAEGLAFKGGDMPEGFTIAGKDKIFRLAEARIDGETVILSHPQVEEPDVARYGCEKKRSEANVFNGAGLPMIAFRTDWSVTGGIKGLDD